MKKPLYFVIMLTLCFVLPGSGYLAYGETEPASTDTLKQSPLTDTLPSIAHATAAKSLWICPMHAHIMQDHAGSCPICGMDLVIADNSDDLIDSGIRVDTASSQKLGVRLAEATEQPLNREIHTIGEVRIDQSSVLEINPKTDGWIKRVNIHYAGQFVQKGDVLYEIYSPDLVQRQREYIELLDRRDKLLESMTNITGQNARVLASLARERVRFREKFIYADVSQKSLEILDSTRRTIDYLPVTAPTSGYVSQINIRNGSYVAPSTVLLSISDLSRLWVEFELYPEQLAWVKTGDSVIALPQTGALRPAHGKLEYLSPLTNITSQTKTARFTIENKNESLSPGMFVDVVITTASRNVVVLPREAIMHTGHGDMVMLSRDNGHFMPIPVETGLETSDFVEIRNGLLEGSKVASNGQYLLDAASSLNDTRQRMLSAD